MGVKLICQPGTVFGDWTVIREGGRSSSRYRRSWFCRCVCGVERDVIATDVRRGASKSCGCLRGKRISEQKWKGVGEIGSTKWTTLVRQAKARNIEVTIDINYMWALFLKQNRCCAVTGIPLTMSTFDTSRHLKTMKYQKSGGWGRGFQTNGTASLDRIDNTKGYIENNVQWVHKDINQMKMDFTMEYFIELCNKVVLYSKVFE